MTLEETEVRRRGLTNEFARDEQQHRPQLDLAGLVYMCIGV